MGIRLSLNIHDSKTDKQVFFYEFHANEGSIVAILNLFKKFNTKALELDEEYDIPWFTYNSKKAKKPLCDGQVVNVHVLLSQQVTRIRSRNSETRVCHSWTLRSERVYETNFNTQTRLLFHCFIRLKTLIFLDILPHIWYNMFVIAGCV